jgi:hypothetical protein
MYESYANFGQSAYNQESFKELTSSGNIGSIGNMIGGDQSLILHTGSGNLMNKSSRDERGSKSSTLHIPSKAVKTPSAGFKQWLSYERRAVAVAATQGGRRQPMMTERSVLSQVNPNDEHGGCMVSCMTFVGLRPEPVLMAPTPGEDVCGTCQNNKPLLQMQFCEHKVSDP